MLAEWRGLLFVAAGALVRQALRLILAQRVRQAAGVALLLLGLVVQGVLILVACYLIDLGIGLMELWAELARKHLELTI